MEVPNSPVGLPCWCGFIPETPEDQKQHQDAHAKRLAAQCDKMVRGFENK